MAATETQQRSQLHHPADRRAHFPHAIISPPILALTSTHLHYANKIPTPLSYVKLLWTLQRIHAHIPKKPSPLTYQLCNQLPNPTTSTNKASTSPPTTTATHQAQFLKKLPHHNKLTRDIMVFFPLPHLQPKCEETEAQKTHTAINLHTNRNPTDPKPTPFHLLRSSPTHRRIQIWEDTGV